MLAVYVKPVLRSWSFGIEETGGLLSSLLTCSLHFTYLLTFSLLKQDCTTPSWPSCTFLSEEALFALQDQFGNSKLMHWAWSSGLLWFCIFMLDYTINTQFFYIMCFQVLIRDIVKVSWHAVPLLFSYFHILAFATYITVFKCWGVSFHSSTSRGVLKKWVGKSEYGVCKLNRLTFSKSPVLFVFHFQHTSTLQLVGLGHDLVF